MTPETARSVGGWLFRNRGWLPVPLLLAMAVLPLRLAGPGLAVVATGEALRFWAVGHIGLASRTRGDGAARVVASGPYRLVRNPLYVGNIVIFLGLGIMKWPWGVVAAPLLALDYHFIVAWEEGNLAARLGEPYREYLARVPRWVPAFPASQADAPAWAGAEALRSERSTFLALAVVLAGMFLVRG